MNLALAEANKGRTSPNPRVGAVIVDAEGAVVATGYHKAAGEAHAEVDAIANLEGSAKGLTMVVTLEPCGHQGRTGPCTDAIIEAGIATVVIGCEDPARPDSDALQKLKSAGIEVRQGVQHQQAQRLIADFAKHRRTGLPLVTLKAAMTLDGKMATRSGDSKWITGEPARTEAHRMRDDSDAVLVGIDTVLADDPALTVRHVPGRDPLRVVLDSKLRIDPDAKLVTQASDHQTLVFVGPDADQDKRATLSDRGVVVHQVETTHRGLALEPVLKQLGSLNVLRLLVEGGPTVHGAFLDADLADRAALFIAPRILGDAQAPGFAHGKGVDAIAKAWQLNHVQTRTVGDDLLVTGDLVR